MLSEYVINPADPVQACSALVSDWKQRIEQKVFALRARFGISDVRAYYEQLFPHLGTPAALAEDVRIGDRGQQRTGEIWFEVRYDPRFPDAYRHSANAQPLHTDGSYIPTFPNATILCCVANADEGGETTFIDSEDVVTALKEENPRLFEQLSTVVMPHARSGDRRELPVLYRKDDRWFVNWNYYCVAADVEPALRAIADEFHAFLQSSPMIRSRTVEVKLAPGDAVTWKDDEVLHGRNGFSATAESERFIWKCAINIGVLNGAA